MVGVVAIVVVAVVVFVVVVVAVFALVFVVVVVFVVVAVVAVVAVVVVLTPGGGMDLYVALNPFDVKLLSDLKRTTITLLLISSGAGIFPPHNLPVMDYMDVKK